MKVVEVGSVVKFKEGGELCGGTVVKVLEDGKLAINTIDNRNIIKPILEVELVKYQRKGKPSASFLKKLKKQEEIKPIIKPAGDVPIQEVLESVAEDIAGPKVEEFKNKLEAKIKRQQKLIVALKNALLLLYKGDSMWLEEILNLIEIENEVNNI